MLPISKIKMKHKKKQYRRTLTIDLVLSMSVYGQNLKGWSLILGHHLFLPNRCVIYIVAFANLVFATIYLSESISIPMNLL